MSLIPCLSLSDITSQKQCLDSRKAHMHTLFLLHDDLDNHSWQNNIR